MCNDKIMEGGWGAPGTSNFPLQAQVLLPTPSPSSFASSAINHVLFLLPSAEILETLSLYSPSKSVNENDFSPYTLKGSRINFEYA